MKKSELREMIREEYQKIIEAPVPPRVKPEADPEQSNFGQSTDQPIGPPMVKQISKIANLSQVKRLISKLPARPASEMADIIMSLIDIFDGKTNDPKSRLVTRELIVKLRDKLRN